MKCRECRTENKQGANFCLKCGERLPQKECPQCGTGLPAEAGFCDNCGLRLPGSQEKAPSPSSDPGRHAGPFRTNGSTVDVTDAERKFVTVLFADVSNYTAMADRMDPEDVHQIVDECFKILYEVVHRSGGMVTSFSGDGMMALFGAPLAREDHAQRACHSALSMQSAMEGYGETVRQQYGVEFSIRIGINSGLAIVGTVGEGYTALGDTTNVAFRLQSVGIPGSITVSKGTRRLADRFFKFDTLASARVKGKEREIEACRLIGEDRVERWDVSGPRRAVRFVGRLDELAGLRRAFERARSASGQIVGISGEAGVGKSRLISEFINGLTPESFSYLTGECLHFGSPIAYLPILGVMRSHLGVEEGMGEAIIKERIDQAVKEAGLDRPYTTPPLYELFSLPVEDDSYLGLEPKRRRERLLETVKDLLISISEQKPLVITVENLLWIDRSSEEFLTYFMPWLVHARVFLILVYRPEYAPPWKTLPHFMHISLRGLDEAEGPRIMGSLLHDENFSGELQEFVTVRARGNPLFIEELTLSLLENGYLQKGPGGYALAERASEIPTPGTIQGIVASRIDRLTERGRHTLQAASVIGKAFTLPILGSVILNQDDLRMDLLQLQASEFIVQIPALGEARYEFRHDLLQDVAYNSLLIRKRKELHQIVANAIETLYAGELREFYEILAHHYSKSENASKAYQYLKLSGIKASQSLSLWEAFRHYGHALNILERDVSPPANAEKLELLLLIASPMISLGFPEDSLELLKKGEGLAREINSAQHVTAFSSMIGLYYSVRGQLLSGLTYSEEAFNSAEETGKIDLIAPTAFDLCSNYAARGEFLKVRQVAPRVLAQIEKAGRQKDAFDRGYNVYTALLAFWGFSEGYLGNFREGDALCEKGFRFCQSIQNLYSLGMTEVCHGYILAHRGNGSLAVPHFLKAIKYLERGQILVLLGLAWSGLGWAHYFMGNFETAATYIEKGLAIHSDAGIHYKSSVHYWFLAPVLLEQGNMLKAKECAEEALKHARSNDEIYIEGISQILMGMITSRVDHSPLAEEYLRAGLTILEGLGIKPFFAIGNLYLAEHYRNRGDAEKAFESLGIAAAIFEKADMPYWLNRLRMDFPDYG